MFRRQHSLPLILRRRIPLAKVFSATGVDSTAVQMVK
jgi:hypothetical protein